MTERITLKMIAEKAGVHFSTVSLALNNHPSIPATTRKRLQTLAEEMGYRPDPVLSALVAYRSRKRKQVEHGVLAWVDTWPDRVSASFRFDSLWTGASERAKSFGWKLEEFRMEQMGFSPGKFSRMLRARGIEGVMIAPMPGQGGTLALEWPWFSCVTVSHTLTSPRLSRVVPHQAYNMQLLMQKLYALGYQRPGLVLEHAINERTQHFWMAAFLDAQLRLPKARRLPPLMQIFDDNEEILLSKQMLAARKLLLGKELLAWQAHHQPDVIIAHRPEDTIGTLEAAGIRVPSDVGVASPSLFPTAIVPDTTAPGNASEAGLELRDSPTQPKPISKTHRLVREDLCISGIDQCYHAIGAAAIESLVAMIHRHESGVPVRPKHILVEGRWQPGNTVIQQSGRKS